MGFPKQPTDLLVVNGWYLELPNLTSPHFETFSAIGRTTGTVFITDAGTNRKFKFSDQLEDIPDLTLTRPYQGNADDIALETMVTAMIKKGLRVNAVLHKYHQGKKVFSFLFEGFRFTGITYPNQDVNSGEKFTVSYGATVFDWHIQRSGSNAPL